MLKQPIFSRAFRINHPALTYAMTDIIEKVINHVTEKVMFKEDLENIYKIIWLAEVEPILENYQKAFDVASKHYDTNTWQHKFTYMMFAKQNLINDQYPKEFTVNYFTEEDAKLLSNYKVSDTIFQGIVKGIFEKMENLQHTFHFSADTCPYCWYRSIKCHNNPKPSFSVHEISAYIRSTKKVSLSLTSCILCEYGKHHGICSASPQSDYAKILNSLGPALYSLLSRDLTRWIPRYYYMINRKEGILFM